MLDRTEQRIIGVLVEKELSVPDSYPLTLNSLLAGCNQKSNRDPEMSLEEFEVNGALMNLRLKDWVYETKGDGARSTRFRHAIERKLGISARDKPILAELLVRGPQTVNELRARVARMGLHVASTQEIEVILQGLVTRSGGPLVELLARGSRERDARWCHRLGRSSSSNALPSTVAGVTQTASPPVVPPHSVSRDVRADSLADLERRIAELEARVGKLEELSG